MRPCAFLDRDGVINVDRGYVSEAEDFEFIPGAAEAIKLLNDKGYLVIVITNQSGIGRGLYTEPDFRKLMAHLVSELSRRGARLDAMYYCPHHPDAVIEEYRMVCRCRKPGPELIERAIRDWGIDPAASFMIGDKDTDIEAAKAAGVKGYLFNGPNLLDFIQTEILQV